MKTAQGRFRTKYIKNFIRSSRPLSDRFADYLEIEPKTVKVGQERNCLRPRLVDDQPASLALRRGVTQLRKARGLSAGTNFRSA